MDLSLEEPENSLFDFKSVIVPTPEPVKIPTISSLRIDPPQNIKKHVFQNESSDSDSWQTDSDLDEDEAAGVLKRLLKPNPFDLGGFKQGTPENGSQYLFTVMKEAKKAPKLVKALNQEEIERKVKEAELNHRTEKPYFQIPSEIKEVKSEPVQPSQLPSLEWETKVIARFSELHSKVDRWRGLMEQNRFRVPIPDGVIFPDFESKMKWVHFFYGTQIYTQIHQGLRKRINCVERINCLERIDSFFTDDLLSTGTANNDIEVSAAFSDTEIKTEPIETEVIQSEEEDENKTTTSSSSSESEDDEDNQDASAKVIPRQHPQMSIMLNLGQRSLEQLLSMSLSWLKHFGWVHELQGQWFYAILVCLQKPLEASVVGDLRELARNCRATRAAVWKSQAEYEVEASNSLKVNPNNVTSFLNTMNLFICLVGSYFQQRDLADV